MPIEVRYLEEECNDHARDTLVVDCQFPRPVKFRPMG
jgi:hypothetical protein